METTKTQNGITIVNRERAADVLIKIWLYSSLITGGLFTLLALLAAYELHFKAVYALVGGLVVVLGFWLALFFWKGIPLAENLLKVDLNGNNQIDPLQTPTDRQNRPPFRAIVESDKGHEEQWLNLPFENDEVIDFLQACLADETNLRNFRAMGFTDSDVDTARNELFVHGYASWKGDDHKTGWQLTKPGKAAVRQVLRVMGVNVDE